ncbi:hypothetical protein ASU31_18330 [Pedobacter ginsenosidimutans]|uniref:Thioredoxin-like fold domain-containing protein n=2 Tax=Pedobacter ginsenosidimutans TaxID=687842 RepID=A0A0T5VL78_9SPHI|nr:hypothetical protein ASU31_18330 [Pedobacter ginsenosidimutans]
MLSGCADHNQYMDELTYKQLTKIGHSDDILLVYYFDGDCSMCLAKVKAIEKYTSAAKSGLSPVFIAKTMNPQVMHFNLAQLNVKSAVYQERHNEFEKAIVFNKITKINPKRVVTEFNEAEIAQ